MGFAAILAGAGAAANLAGTQQATAANIQTAAFQEQVALNNQTIASANAADILEVGRVNEETQRLATAGQLGTARASAAARGVEVGTGSAADIEANIAAVGEQEALTIRANAAKAAAAGRQTAQQFATEAELQRLARSQARKAGGISSISSILGGATSVSSKFQTT